MVPVAAPDASALLWAEDLEIHQQELLLQPDELDRELWELQEEQSVQDQVDLQEYSDEGYNESWNFRIYRTDFWLHS